MIDLFIAGGPFMWVLLLITLTVLYLSVRDAVSLITGGGRDRAASGSRSDAILFWGCIAVVLGVLATFYGLYLSMSAIRARGVLNPELLAEGISVASLTTIFGLLILAYSALAWFVLRRWSRKAGPRIHEEAA
jgi:biopolymer transport protein ExbB/TolQ